MEKPGSEHWSNCAIPPKFFGIHAISVIPWVLAIVLRGSFYTFYIAIFITGMLIWIELIKRMDVASAKRAFNIYLTGREKPARSAIKDFIGR